VGCFASEEQPAAGGLGDDLTILWLGVNGKERIGASGKTVLRHRVIT
jgi:hypothetical protein